MYSNIHNTFVLACPLCLHAPMVSLIISHRDLIFYLNLIHDIYIYMHMYAAYDEVFVFVT